VMSSQWFRLCEELCQRATTSPNVSERQHGETEK
jgi:hypothetical protein